MVTGSSSNDEAVFVFLGDALRSGAAPPETQRAMIAAMARLPHIETERTQGHAGRPCLAVRYLEPERSRVVPSVCCDETTATLVEEDTLVDGEIEFRSVVVERGVVTKVPDEVRRNAPSPQRDPNGPGSTGS